MSDTDSFIDEVTEEVRRDALFAQFRRYGWHARGVFAKVHDFWIDLIPDGLPERDG